MPLVVPNAGEDAMLKDALGKTTPANLTIKLYTNDYVPLDVTTAGAFTEMTGQGYVAKTMTMASWTESNISSIGTAAYPVQTWTFTAGGPTTIYGYYVVGADGIIRWAERFGTAFVAQFAGDAVSITPQFTLQSVA